MWPCSLFESRATLWGSRRAMRRQTASVTWSKRTGPVRKHNTQTENRARRWPREHIEMWYWSRAWNRTVCTGLKQRESIATNAAFHNYFYHLTSSEHVQSHRNATKSLVAFLYCDRLITFIVMTHIWPEVKASPVLIIHVKWLLWRMWEETADSFLSAAFQDLISLTKCNRVEN